jgi:hypothetical protein
MFKPTQNERFTAFATVETNTKCTLQCSRLCSNQHKTHGEQQSPNVQIKTKRTLHSSRRQIKPTQNARCTAVADCSNQHKTHGEEHSPIVQTKTKPTLHSSRRKFKPTQI